MHSIAKCGARYNFYKKKWNILLIVTKTNLKTICIEDFFDRKCCLSLSTYCGK